MKFLILAILPVLSLIDVRWDSVESEAIRVKISSLSEEMNSCLSSSLELRIRYEIKFCSQRSFWFDNCGRERIETKTIRYDPISEKYSLESDKYHDKIQPDVQTFNERDDAVALATNLSLIQLNDLPERDKLRGSREYVGVRVVAICKGASGGVLEQIPWFMSFGLYDPAVLDSGWIAFNLTR